MVPGDGGRNLGSRTVGQEQTGKQKHTDTKLGVYHNWVSTILKEEKKYIPSIY